MHLLMFYEQFSVFVDRRTDISNRRLKGSSATHAFEIEPSHTGHQYRYTII